MKVTLFLVSSSNIDDFIEKLEDMDFPGQVEVTHFQMGGYISGRALVELVEIIEEKVATSTDPVICCFTDTFWLPDESLVERLEVSLAKPSILVTLPRNIARFPSSIKDSSIVKRGDNTEQILKIGIDEVKKLFG